MQSVYKITKKKLGNFGNFKKKKRYFFLNILKFLKELLREFQKKMRNFGNFKKKKRFFFLKFSKFLKELLRMPLFKQTTQIVESDTNTTD